MKWLLALAMIVGAGGGACRSRSASANGFEVRHAVQIVIPQAGGVRRVRADFAMVERRAHLQRQIVEPDPVAQPRRLLLRDGCPTAAGSSIMHVAYVDPGERLVLTGALGPLLYQAATGVMDIKVERIAGGSRLTLDYKVAGFANGGADKLAPVVDQVLGDQMARFRKYAAAMPRDVASASALQRDEAERRVVAERDPRARLRATRR